MGKIETEQEIITEVMPEHNTKKQTKPNMIEPDEEITIDLFESYDRKVPHITKYMGSKRNILDFVIESINENYNGGVICDLFAGTSILSGALGKLAPMHSNDVQQYSAVLSRTYLSNYDWTQFSAKLLDDILNEANNHVANFREQYPNLVYTYSAEMTIKQFIQLEKKQQKLLDYKFDDSIYHLFAKYYSGTYWSFDQCLWIDALRRVAENYRETPVYYLILSSLMYGMSYCSQSTGHYAQYRDATSESSKNDILIYRLRSIRPYFESKFNQLKEHLGSNNLEHTVTSLDYRDCLNQIQLGTLVYADPPYAFVHYSRFYHAIETLVRYDYPQVDHKGRYRSDRHQSPFGRRTEVKEAFKSLFEKIKEKQSCLILSYSNTGMITLEQIIVLANEVLENEYEVTYKEEDHKHSTMGRSDDKSKDVKEYLVIAKPR